MKKLPEKILVTPTDREYLDAGYDTGRIYKNTARKTLVTLLLLLCAVSFFQQYIIPESTDPNFVLGILLILLSLALLYPVWFYHTKKEDAFIRRMRQNGCYEICFDDDGIAVKNSISEYRFLKGERLVFKCNEQRISFLSPEKGELTTVPARATDKENYSLAVEYLKENFKSAGLD